MKYALLHKNSIIHVSDDYNTTRAVLHKVLPKDGDAPVYMVKVIQETKTSGQGLQAVFITPD
jgi:hypothetical protein